MYDYVLVTEPLTDDQLRSIGWEGRQGLADLGNQFHYYRLTADNRILWGGYDVIYHFGNKIRAEQDQRLSTSAALAEQFFTTFPQLEGTRFTHRWGGVIDTCSRFTAFWGRAYAGRLAYAVGYTGLGVGATPVRRAGAARPAGRGRQRTDEAGDGSQQAAAVPARTVPLHRHPADPMGDRPGRPQRRTPQPLAAGTRQGRTGLRVLNDQLGMNGNGNKSTKSGGPRWYAKLM